MKAAAAEKQVVEPVRRPGSPSFLYLGHAGFVVTHGPTRILIDPWFHPAFCESWFPYPDNRALLERVVATRYDALFVSHAHQDHFDSRLLEKLPRDLPVLCANFRSRSVEKAFRRLGFRQIIALDHLEERIVGPGVCATAVLDTSHKEDSALLLGLDGFRFLHLNDCHPRLGELPRDVDLLAAQFSGAMWYPNCYDYPPEVTAAKVAEVRADLLDTLVRTVAATDAKHLVPCAGPPVFLDPDLRAFNDPTATIFPRWENVAPSFAAAAPQVGVVRVDPGDRVDVAGGKPRAVAAATAAPSEIADYARRRRAEWSAYRDRPDQPVETAELEAYFSRLQRRNRLLLLDYRREFRLVCDGRAWVVRVGFAPGPPGEPPDTPVVRAVDDLAGAFRSTGYELRVPNRVLRAVVAGDLSWEEALLSMRVRLARDPDRFDVTLLGLLRYGETPVVTWQMRRDHTAADETVERDGFRIQRYCPHAGEDLTEATVTGTELECPRHHWVWDLTTGRCLRGGTLPLTVAPLEG